MKEILMWRLDPRLYQEFLQIGMAPKNTRGAHTRESLTKFHETHGYQIDHKTQETDRSKRPHGQKFPPNQPLNHIKFYTEGR